MTDETTSEQLAEIEGQAESTPATEYTPPEGWRVVRFGELLQPGDMWVNEDGTEQRSAILHWDAAAVSGGRCIRPIEPQPEAQPQPEPQPIQVREGRWRTRGGDIRDVIPTPNYDERATKCPWYDAKYDQAWQNNGRYFPDEENHRDLVEYLGPIEPDKTQELATKTQELQAEYTPPEGWRVLAVGELLQPGDEWVNWEGTVSRPDIQHGDGTTASGGRYIRRIKPQPQPEPHAATIEELRSEVSYVQRLLGESRQRVTHLEELASSLRTINVAQEKAFEAAGKENTALRNQLTAVKAELASVAADRQRLRVELDAAQQVPADSPELRQLRENLEQATLGRDTYRDGYERVLSDLRTIRETTAADTVETIAEWLQAFRGCNSPALALLLLEALPAIMRSLTGLDDEEIA